jgi:putative hemolysin
MKSQKAVVIVVVASVLLLAGCIVPPTPTPAPTSPASNMANPASVYCQQNGGTVEIRTDNTGAQAGVCRFADGSECDEWAYYRGECGPKNGTAVPATPKLSEADALKVATAASACTDVGTVQTDGFYNPNSRTWWFNLAGSSKPGCNPACVIGEDGSAEVNWRCTGAVPPTATP